MVILQVIPELNAGGAERTTIEVAEAIADAGGTALVASRGGRLEDELTAAGGRLIRLDMKTKNPLAAWRNTARLARIVQRKGVDVLHARSRAPAWSTHWAAKRTGAAFVTTYHGTYQARSALKRVYNSIMARGDRVIANSDFIAAHVRAQHRVSEDRLRVIPRGVDLDRFDPDAVDPQAVARLRKAWGAVDRPLILLPGRLTGWKGQAFFINMLDDFEAAKDAVLACVGDAQGREAYRESLQHAARAAGVRLVLPGHLSDMSGAYAAADVVVCPSLEPEAFGRTAAEAQAMGAPVIAADHGGAREVVIQRETGWRAAPGDAAAWRRALSEALSLTPEGRTAMAARARARIAAQFSKPALQAATLRVYRELLE